MFNFMYFMYMWVTSIFIYFKNVLYNTYVKNCTSVLIFWRLYIQSYDLCKLADLKYSIEWPE